MTEPYAIAIEQSTLDDLRRRLGEARWADAVEGAGWDYGTDLDYLRELAAYWRDGFDWRAQEEEINRFDHFRAEVEGAGAEGEGVGIHLLHQRSSAEDAVPLLLLHGWPASFLQMLKIVPLLAADFHVVVPSLPGFGFSDRPARRGMSTGRIAELLASLMRELGYDRYGVRGSDIGYAVAVGLAAAAPDRVMGLHLSGTSPFPPRHVPDDLTPAEQRFIEDGRRWQEEELAYAALQITRPQTLAFALNDSPIGLASWIVEKYRRWSDCDGDVERAFTKDELLANLTVYWATETIGSSMRLYYESLRRPRWPRVDVPTAMAMLPVDFFPTPREWVERSSRVDRWTELPRGGHFGEHEVPDLLAEDMRAFFLEDLGGRLSG